MNTFSPSPVEAINALSANANYADVWKTGEGIVNYLQDTDVNFNQGHAYSIVISQAADVDYFARVCAANYYVGHPMGNTPSSAWGSCLILQMR
jgi:hypothetical protein